jgi:hypothetical protein
MFFMLTRRNGQMTSLKKYSGTSMSKAGHSGLQFRHLPPSWRRKSLLKDRPPLRVRILAWLAEAHLLRLRHLPQFENSLRFNIQVSDGAAGSEFIRPHHSRRASQGTNRKADNLHQTAQLKYIHSFVSPLVLLVHMYIVDVLPTV